MSEMLPLKDIESREEPEPEMSAEGVEEAVLTRLGGACVGECVSAVGGDCVSSFVPSLS
jgi:hypothetical protein